MDKNKFSTARYVTAIALVVAALFARWTLTPYVEGRLPFALLMLALVVISASSGFGPGLLALAIGVLATMWFFLEPIHSLRVQELPLQITVVAYIIVGLGILLLGEKFRRAREQTLAFEELLGQDFKETGEVYVRTAQGLQLLRTRPIPEGSPPRRNRPELPLDRIISEIIPSLAEIIDTPNWQVLADGKPVVNVVLRDVPRPNPSAVNWVVAEIAPLVAEDLPASKHT